MATTTISPPLTALPLLIPDVNVSAEIIKDRRARGIDHHDEVWEGVYVMSPIANNEHQKLIARLTSILVQVIDDAGLGESFPGVNVTDQQQNWQRNFRCPDVVAFLNGNPAQNRGTHWFGGPDFAVEIVSPYDRSREKLDFYAKIGTRELLIVDRDSWQLELFRLDGANAGLGESFPGVNVTDQQQNWQRNFRCPDVVAFLNGNPAQNRGTHWFGGPDFAVEIVSPYDRSREKLDFYAKIGTRELLIVDRDSWQLELFRLDGAILASVGICTLERPVALASERTSLGFTLTPGQERPQIAVAHASDGRMWTV